MEVLICIIGGICVMTLTLVILFGNAIGEDIENLNKEVKELRELIEKKL